MSNASRLGAGRLHRNDRQVKQIIRTPRRVPPKPPAARLVNLQIYLAGRFEEIIRCADYGEAVGQMDDLENMICYHPDLLAYAGALRKIVEGNQIMFGLCADVLNLTDEQPALTAKPNAAES